MGDTSPPTGVLRSFIERPKTKDLNSAQQKSIISHLLSMKKDEDHDEGMVRLKHGAITKTAKFFHVN